MAFRVRLMANVGSNENHREEHTQVGDQTGRRGEAVPTGGLAYRNEKRT